EHLGAKADKAAGGHAELHAHAAGAVVRHLHHLALARAEALDDGADEVLRDIDGEVLDGLHGFAVDDAGDDLRPADHELVTFAAHHLDDDGELQLAAAEDFETVGGASVFDADGDVGEQLFVETLAQVAAGDGLPFAAGCRRVIDRELHGDGGLVDDDGRQRLGVLEIDDGFPDGDAADTGNGDDVADYRFGNIGALEPFEGEELGDLGFLQRSIALGDVDLIAGFERAVEDARDAKAAEIVGVVEIGDLDLEWAGGVPGSGLQRGDDGFEERLQGGAGGVERERGGAVLGIGVEHREIELILGGIEIDEQVVYLVENFLGAGIGTVDLVDDQDGGQLGFERLGENVPGLGQRAFRGVDQQHDAIDHFEGAFDFAAEVGVAGGVDDVDLGVLVMDRRVLGQDGDAALFLELVRVHDALDDGLIAAEGAGLAEHGVDEGGLAVVDVSDDGDVADGAGHGDAFSLPCSSFFLGTGGVPPSPLPDGRQV